MISSIYRNTPPERRRRTPPIEERQKQYLCREHHQITHLATDNIAYYLISPSNDPFYNIALEDYLYQGLRHLSPIYMFWINRPSVFMGRYQCAEAETDWSYLQQQSIPILRRSSGGGTVYHDWGNLNYTCIQSEVKRVGFDLKSFPSPIIDAVAKEGVSLTLSPRGDLRLDGRIDGRKVGGSAEAMRQGRMLYHLSLLFSADLDELERVLTPSQDSEHRSRVASVRSKVANLSSVLNRVPDIDAFRSLILDELRLRYTQLIPLDLSTEAEQYIREIQETKFAHPDWIHSPIGKSTRS